MVDTVAAIRTHLIYMSSDCNRQQCVYTISISIISELVGLIAHTSLESMYQLRGLLVPLTVKAKDLFRFFLYSDHSNQIVVNNEP